MLLTPALTLRNSADTVTVADAVALPLVAVMVAVPGVTDVTVAESPDPLTEATPGLDDDHETAGPLTGLPRRSSAVACTLCDTPMPCSATVAGATVSRATLSGPTASCLPPQEAVSARRTNRIKPPERALLTLRNMCR
jgi:hypothetical protein